MVKYRQINRLSREATQRCVAFILIKRGKEELNDFINKIINLIETVDENEFVDYKEKEYSKDNKSDLIKDLLSMANSLYSGDKFIIVGVRDEPGVERKVVGIERVQDQEIYQSWIEPFVEPRIKFDYKVIKYKEKDIGIYVISKENNNKPYMIKKEFTNGKRLNEGDCFIRHNSKNCRATRRDFDSFYENRKEIKINILDNIINITPLKSELPPYYIAPIEVNIFNKNKYKIIFKYIGLNIKKLDGKNLFTVSVNAIDKKIDNLYLEVEPNGEYLGEISFGFGSNHCLLMNLNEYGEPEEDFIIQLVLEDTNGEKYESEEVECYVQARGSILHKVWLQKGINNRDRTRLLHGKNIYKK